MEKFRTSDPVNYVARMAGVKIHDFDGNVDSTNFFAWVKPLRDYSDCKFVPNNKKVWLAEYKLKGTGHVWWHGVQEKIHRTNQPPINSIWNEAKDNWNFSIVMITSKMKNHTVLGLSTIQNINPEDPFQVASNPPHGPIFTYSRLGDTNYNFFCWLLLVKA